ncbi:MAG: hypothetical protein NZ845_01005 [Thermodesulfovibrio sp.]|nr:hypothetical protein [Thermodesulfovibrio sp.]
MNIQLYFADEELREVEKAVYELTDSHNNQRLDGEYLLEKLFERGFTFGKFSKNKIKKIILGFIKNWTQYEIERLKSEYTSNDLKIRTKIENVQIIQTFLKLAPKIWYIFNDSMNLATKIMKEQKLKNFMRVIYEALHCPNPEELERRRRMQEFFKAWNERKKSTKFFSERREQATKKDSYEPTPFPEEIEEEIKLLEQSSYGKFLKILYPIIDQYEKFPKEELKSLFDSEEINFEEMTVKQLISLLYAIAEYEVERKIKEDEYMSERFYYGDFDEIGAPCKDLEDLESKDCQLARLYYLWVLIEEGGGYYDYKLFESLESMINFTDAERNLIELIKEQITIRQKRERERWALIRKKRKKKKEFQENNRRKKR